MSKFILILVLALTCFAGCYGPDASEDLDPNRDGVQLSDVTAECCDCLYDQCLPISDWAGAADAFTKPKVMTACVENRELADSLPARDVDCMYSVCADSCNASR